MKRMRTDCAGRLLVEVRSLFPLFVGMLNLIFLPWLGYLWLSHSHDVNRMIGLAGAAGTCLLFLACYESCDFIFDSQARKLNWTRRMGLFKSRGEVRLSDITRIAVETCMGADRYYPKQRVMLITCSGELALTRSYEHDDMNAVVAERIRAFLGMPAEEPVAATLEALVAAGRDIDAIRMLRQERGISLTQARDELKRIRITAGSGSRSE